VGADVDGLAAGATYHVRLVATNETGTSYGDDHAFQTAAWVAPVAQTAGAMQVGPLAATLAGRLNANDAATTYHFEYGPTTAYGRATPDVPAGGHALLAVTAVAAGLASSTTYHFRLVATNPGGTTAGADATFTTAGARADAMAPTVKLGAPTCPASVKGKACQAYLLSTAAWRTLKGTASDPSGLAGVQVNVYRKAAGTCFAYTGDGFAKQRCDRADDAWVDAAVTGASWKLALRSLPAGTYTIRVRATDRAKNTVSAFRSGQNQLAVKLA
jgi:hypothetical protein